MGSRRLPSPGFERRSEFDLSPQVGEMKARTIALLLAIIDPRGREVVEILDDGPGYGIPSPAPLHAGGVLRVHWVRTMPPSFT
jgi:hypothetical protein